MVTLDLVDEGADDGIQIITDSDLLSVDKPSLERCFEFSHAGYLKHLYER